MHAKQIEVCQMIRRDMERDMAEMEGKPFTGHNVSVQFGHQAAAISALARIVEKLLAEQAGDGTDDRD